jgi:nitrate reductase gamma subunit
MLRFCQKGDCCGEKGKAYSGILFYFHRVLGSIIFSFWVFDSTVGAVSETGGGRFEKHETGDR